jgi:hypothetical protein
MKNNKKDILIRGIDKKTHDKLKKIAEKNYRSVNKECLIAIKKHIGQEGTIVHLK